jgi:uncharacterized membrane protein
MIVLPYSSTSPNKGNSHTNKKHSMRLGATVTEDPVLLLVLTGSYVQEKNHSMVMIIVQHGQICLVT